MRTIGNVAKEEYNLGIVRYQSIYEPYFEQKFTEKNLTSRLLCEFSYVLLVSEKSPLAAKKCILPKDLEPFIEISHADPYVPSLPLIDARKAELSEYVDKHIFVFERGSQFRLLESVPNTFMWVSPIPEDLLTKYRLVQIPAESPKKHRDVFIHRDDYKLTALDNRFIEEVIAAKRRILDAQ